MIFKHVSGINMLCWISIIFGGKLKLIYGITQNIIQKIIYNSNFIHHIYIPHPHVGFD